MASEQQAVEPIYFFREARRRAQRSTRSPLLLVWALVGASMLAALVVWRLGKWAGLGFFADLLGVLVTMTMVAVANYPNYARWRYRKQVRDLPPEPAGSEARLACIGAPQQLRRFGELGDRSFEPVFFSATFVQPFSRRMHFLTWLLAVPGVVAAHFAVARLTPHGAAFWTPLLQVKLYVGLSVAVVVVAWLYPTCFRIVPGRLDVMRFNNLFNRPVAVEHYDLRTAKLLIDLRHGVIFIDDADGRTGEFPIVWMRRSTRERLAYHLLLAALSTHQTPMLPDDRLLG